MAESFGIPQDRRPTLSDVAKRAGVSPTLVSMVMRDAPGASAQTRARVIRVAEQLGYRPDVRARALAGRRSRLIGVVFGMVGTFHFQLLDGLYAAAAERGYEIILSAVTPGRDEEAAVRTLHDFNLDALVMLAPYTRTPVLAGKLPLVVVGWEVDDPNVDVVMTSQEQGMALAVGHLVDSGHRRIVHIDGGDNLVSEARRAGYEHAMKKHGLRTMIRVVRGGITQLEGAEAARKILRHKQLPTAIMSFNDETAAGALEVMRMQGFKVPADISIIGWDNGPTAQLPHIQLTTVNQDTRLMAQVILDRLIERSDGGDIDDRKIILEPELIRRETTTIVAGDEPRVPKLPDAGRLGTGSESPRQHEENLAT